MLTDDLGFWISMKEIEMRKRYSADHWAAWFEEFDRSGLSVAEFCQRIDVGQNSFYFWRRKAKSETGDLEDHFVPVVIQATSQASI